METLKHIISLKRELLEREIHFRTVLDYSAGMADDQMKRYIHYLVDSLNEEKLTNQAMHLVLEDFLKAQEDLLRQLSELQTRQAETASRLTEEIRKRKQAEQQSKKLQEELQFAKKQRFGDKRQWVEMHTDKKDLDNQEDEKDKLSPPKR